MNRKLLFFDIDGTLLSENGIPESTRKALAEARKRGCMLFVNTGRTKVSIPLQVKKLILTDISVDAELIFTIKKKTFFLQNNKC